jgi:hypothetical protein
LHPFSSNPLHRGFSACARMTRREAGTPRYRNRLQSAMRSGDEESALCLARSLLPRSVFPSGETWKWRNVLLCSSSGLPVPSVAVGRHHPWPPSSDSPANYAVSLRRPCGGIQISVAEACIYTGYDSS